MRVAVRNAEPDADADSDRVSDCCLGLADGHRLADGDSFTDRRGHQFTCLH